MFWFFLSLYDFVNDTMILLQNLAVRDTVRECLEKDPSERTEDDIKVLLEFTQRLKAFADKTLAVRRAMCQAMVSLKSYYSHLTCF